MAWEKAASNAVGSRAEPQVEAGGLQLPDIDSRGRRSDPAVADGAAQRLQRQRTARLSTGRVRAPVGPEGSRGESLALEVGERQVKGGKQAGLGLMHAGTHVDEKPRRR